MINLKNKLFKVSFLLTLVLIIKNVLSMDPDISRQENNTQSLVNLSAQVISQKIIQKIKSDKTQAKFLEIPEITCLPEEITVVVARFLYQKLLEENKKISSIAKNLFLDAKWNQNSEWFKSHELPEAIAHAISKAIKEYWKNNKLVELWKIFIYDIINQMLNYHVDKITFVRIFSSYSGIYYIEFNIKKSTLISKEEWNNDIVKIMFGHPKFKRICSNTEGTKLWVPAKICITCLNDYVDKMPLDQILKNIREHYTWRNTISRTVSTQCQLS